MLRNIFPSSGLLPMDVRGAPLTILVFSLALYPYVFLLSAPWISFNPKSRGNLERIASSMAQASGLKHEIIRPELDISPCKG